MKFLCLPGAYGSATNFEVQLAPFCKEISSDATFFFTQGTVPCTPPPGFQTYFGPSPHYKFIEWDGTRHEDVLERVRDFPEGENPEDILRQLMPEGTGGVRRGMRIALDALYKTMDEFGPFDGICGYSEGATMAATLILDEQRRLTEEGRTPQIKCAIFFAGWPPVLPNSSQIVLWDEVDTVIDIPTCHIVGAGDPYLPGAMALYNVCEPDFAHLFDHGKGHTIPRDARTLKELGSVVRELVAGAA